MQSVEGIVEVNADPHLHGSRNRALLLACALFLLIGGIWFVFWVAHGRFYVSTEDAYVHGNRVMLTPQVSAGVVTIYAEETDLVQQGQVVVDLDRSKLELRLEAAKEQLGGVVRTVAGYFYAAQAQRAELELRCATLHQAQLDLAHRHGLAETGAISVEEFEQYQTAVDVARAAVEAAGRQFDTAEAMIEGVDVTTHPEVLAAITALRQAYLDLIYCRILAPATGYIAKRRVQVGDFVLAGQTLLEIVPLDQIWVEANYKETQLKRARIGQPVTFSADMHGSGLKYHGHVIGFQAGSGNAFALLPPQNASGNWIKIVQRVPIRISIPEAELLQHPLLLGLSLHVTLDTHDLSSNILSSVAVDQPLYTTDIYATQFAQLDEITALIDQIISENNKHE